MLNGSALPVSAWMSSAGPVWVSPTVSTWTSSPFPSVRRFQLAYDLLQLAFDLQRCASSARSRSASVLFFSSQLF
ncbi:hypothetical protein F511_30472 [Dorcoceras hygrometricum]|uniref:Uncharacterized protein n=1 Tax=Dorcoceras hygrometricum TaxID=472368 RepID=A0A2Z7CJN2_9LAMI|nr:hypothetical protein F511_30472 [Dorcoceras hygrometricum]